MMKWHRVKTTDYYGQWEDIAGGSVRQGARVLVKWPNGCITAERLKLELGNGSTPMDMNDIPDSFRTRKIFIWRKLHGHGSLVPLKGLSVQWVHTSKRSKKATR